MEHLIVNSEKYKSKTGASELIKICSRSASDFDIMIELKLPDESLLFRGRTALESEAQRLLLDVPHYSIGGGNVPLGAVFQLGFRCNQHCIFCTSDRTLPSPSTRFVRDTIARALRNKPSRVIFTGGEPTLDKHLAEYIALCKESGVMEVSIYTNAMKLGNRSYTNQLVDAGLDAALVSLHSHRSQVSDAITRRPGGFTKTIAGLSELLENSIFTVINYVVNALNFADTSDFVRFAGTRFQGAAINFSYAAPVMQATASRDIIPKFSDAVPHLEAALDACETLGIPYSGLEPHWGIPPCALNPRYRIKYFPALTPLSEPPTGFIKARQCSKCVINSSCPGVRIFYAEIYGTSELRSVI